MRLNIKRIAMASGVIWGAFIFLLTWWIIFFDGETQEKTVIGKVYHGYSVSLPGSIIGAIWGFADGLIGSAIFLWIFNRFSRKEVN